MWGRDPAIPCFRADYCYPLESCLKYKQSDSHSRGTTTSPIYSSKFPSTRNFKPCVFKTLLSSTESLPACHRTSGTSAQSNCPCLIQRIPNTLGYLLANCLFLLVWWLSCSVSKDSPGQTLPVLQATFYSKLCMLNTSFSIAFSK